MQQERIEINNEPPTNPSIPSMKLIKLIMAVNIKVIKIKNKHPKYLLSKLSIINKLPEIRTNVEVNI